MISSLCSLVAAGQLCAAPSASRPRGGNERRLPLFRSRSSRVPAISNVNQWHPASRVLTFLTATTFILFPPPLGPIPSILPPLDAPIANSRGLFQMPPPRLVNRYFLVRAGESETERLGLIRTNPVEKTSVDSGLSEEGKKQAVEAAFEIKKMGACDGNCWIWPSITQRSYQAAEIIAAVSGISRRVAMTFNERKSSSWSSPFAQKLSSGKSSMVKASQETLQLLDTGFTRQFIVVVSTTLDRKSAVSVCEREREIVVLTFMNEYMNSCCRSHIVPEYSFLDARGLGAYEGKRLDVVNEAFFLCLSCKNDKNHEHEWNGKGTMLLKVYASDRISPSTKPPPIDDGTPNESVEDVFVRVTQLMSILETQYAGDSIIIVSPDSDNLSVLQAGLVGLDLRRHMDLSFVPGEVRRVDVESIPAYRQPASAVYKCLSPPSCR